MSVEGQYKPHLPPRYPQDVRCGRCGKKLAELLGEIDVECGKMIEIYCRRCKMKNKILHRKIK